MEDVSFVASAFAVIVSFVSIITNIILSKKQIKSEYVTKNRIDWITDVRELLGKFLELYTEGAQKFDLEKIRNKILLYFRENVKSYREVAEQLDICIDGDGYNKDNVSELIKRSQYMLSEVWIRIKRENGMDKKTDDKFKEMFNS